MNCVFILIQTQTQKYQAFGLKVGQSFIKYTPYAWIDQEWQLIEQVTDNYQRCNVLEIAELITNKLKINFEQNYGVKNMRVYQHILLVNLQSRNKKALSLLNQADNAFCYLYRRYYKYNFFCGKVNIACSSKVGGLYVKCFILVAGYATRLYPLTKNTPKPLLKVGGKSILKRLLEKIEVVEEINHIYLVTNSRFAQIFHDWIDKFSYSKSITIIDDGTISNKNRLGAIGDIQYVLEQTQISDDLMVLAGDNLFDFDLRDFVKFFVETNTDLITAYKVNDIEFLRRIGVVELDSKAGVLSFEEKPQNPKSAWGVPALYIYKKETLALFKDYLKEGNNPDAPGNFLPWLIKHKPLHAFKFTGEFYDIGTIDSYQEAQEVFKTKQEALFHANNRQSIWHIKRWYQIFVYTLRNDNNLKVEIINYGGIIVSVSVPDCKGNLKDVALGCDTIEDYLQHDKYFGAIVGKFANRIEAGTSELNGKEYKLAQNNHGNHLYGGLIGSDKVVWESTVKRRDGQNYLELRYLSKDGEEDYPGNLDVIVEYFLTEENRLKINYRATTDQDTVVNLTNPLLL